MSILTWCLIAYLLVMIGLAIYLKVDYDKYCQKLRKTLRCPFCGVDFVKKQYGDRKVYECPYCGLSIDGEDDDEED